MFVAIFILPMALSATSATIHSTMSHLNGDHATILFLETGQTSNIQALSEERKKPYQNFKCLANALSALYSKWSEEKKLIEALLHAAPR